MFADYKNLMDHMTNDLLSNIDPQDSAFAYFRLAIGLATKCVGTLLRLRTDSRRWISLGFSRTISSPAPH
jgi:hypothetical protein